MIANSLACNTFIAKADKSVLAFFSAQLHRDAVTFELLACGITNYIYAFSG